MAPGTLATVRPLGSIEEPWKKSIGILVAGEGPLRPLGCGNGGTAGQDHKAKVMGPGGTYPSAI